MPINAPQGPVTNVEFWLEPGGDFIQTDNGDILLAYDTSFTADATRQRILRKLDSVSRTADAEGRTNTPTDLFNPDYGDNEPVLVDANVDQDFLGSMQSTVLRSVLSEPGVAPNPQPTVSVAQIDTRTVAVSITAKTRSGATVQIDNHTISF